MAGLLQLRIWMTWDHVRTDQLAAACDLSARVEQIKKLWPSLSTRGFSPMACAALSQSHGHSWAC